MGDKRSAFQSFKRVVVKVGTSSVAYDTGKPNLYRIESLVRQISDIHNLGKEVILVTSGAIGTGAGKLPAGASENHSREAGGCSGGSGCFNAYL